MAVLVGTLLTATQLPDALPPVLADTFGNTSTSGLSLVTYQSGIVFYALFAAPSSGSLSSISFFASGSTGPGNVAIFSGPGTLLAQATPQTITDGVNTFSIGGNVPITAGAYYWLALVMTDGSYYRSSSGGQGRNSMAGGCCTMPTQLATVNTVAGSIGIYATYSTFTYSFSNSGGISVTQGASGSNTITATLSSGTAQSVTLSCSGLPTGATCSFNPTSVTPTSGGASTTLTISTMSSTPAGSYTITVTGSPGQTNPTSFTLTVSAFIYTLSNSGSFGVTVGNSGSTTITATLSSGTAQSVTFSCSGLPTGASCSFNPTSVTPTSGGATSTLTLSTSSSTPAGSYTITVTGSPSPSTPTMFTLTVSLGPDFTATATLTSANVAAGATASFTISISAVGGYTETISLSVTSSCPPSSTCSISGSPIASPYSSTGTLTVQTGSTTATGTYTVVVTAAGTTKSHTLSVTVTVAGPTPYNFNVKSGATQIVVTVSWTGSGSSSVIVQGPGGTPTIAESGGVVFDRTSIAVVSGSQTTSLIHRVTFTITATTSAQVWTLLLSISGPTSYNITIEVS